MSADDPKFPITVTSMVTLHLSLALEDGTVVESTFGEDPLTFRMSDGTLDKGLELGLYGLKCGDKQQLTLEPGQAFGQHDASRVHVMNRRAFAADMALEPGVIVGFKTPSGEELPGAVLEVDANSVTVDFNHPLAGRTIIFDVEIIDVVSADTDD